ncbi:MAG: Gfo/Idh/MocA family oxidoreductase [candidate division KSB1 bacterium]|nr:Gfo/Idh/MocA family oxidoreductase [candidate division KSB1 bacterium]
MKALRTAIIGTGKVAHHHAKALRQAPSSCFVAAWNRTFERAEAFAKEYGVTPYRDLEEMIVREKIDVVTVCTTHPTHADVSIAAMRAGAHVLVEKPLASSLQDCDRMIAAARETSKKLGMISQRRLYPPVQRMRRAIDEGKIGDPALGIVTVLGWRDERYYAADSWRGTWKEEGGGVLVNQTPHQLDILQWLMGPIKEVYGLWANLNHPYIEVEDTAVAVLQFANGGLGSIVVSNAQNPALYGRVHVFGRNGAAIGAQTDGGAMFIAGIPASIEAPYNDLWTIPGEESQQAVWKKEDESFFAKIDPTVYFHALQIQDFCQAVLNDRPPMVPAEEGRKTVEIFTAVYRSMRDRKPVPFPVMPEDGPDFDGRLMQKNN